MSDRPPRPAPLSVEPLEPRELPAATPWLVEPFQRGPAAGLPGGWAQWTSGEAKVFRVVSTASGLGDQGRLTASAPTGVDGRAWLSAPFAADVETTAAVYLNTPVPVQLFVRGHGLNSAKPTYYAASVVRGASVSLVKVVDGRATVLGAVQSPDYLSNRWVTVTVRAEGGRIKVFLHRGDTNQYLGADGKWTRQPTAAVERTDGAIRGAGQVGFARPAGAAGDVGLDSLRVGPSSASSPAAAIAEERFNSNRAGLPTGWSQWVRGGKATFATASDDTLRVDAASSADARAWLTRPTPADVQISSSVYVDGLTPAGVFARGSKVNTDKPSYYTLTVQRGLDVRLWRVVDGRPTELGEIRSKDWLSGLWVQASLVATGDQLRVQVFRSDTGQYLNADGSWGLAPAWALTRTDGAIKSGGVAGLSRGPGYAGQLVFDNFIVTSAPAKGSAPGTIPTEEDKATTPRPPGDDLPGPNPTPTPTPTPAPTPTPTPNPALPVVPRNYPHIRLANLAYWGTPFGNTEQSLLRHSIDLVIPNLAYLDDVTAANPKTPQLVYTNVSNIYLGLLTDWNEYADRNRLSREAAFYHVARPTPLTGASASSVPVNRFWGVARGSDATGWTDLTGAARNDTTLFPLGDLGQSVTVGFLEKFREINFDLQSGARNGWAGRLEYVSKVDAGGKPVEWKPLALLGDGTAGFARDGKLTFDPPRDWVAASVNGGARLFTVRVRTTAGGTAPVVNHLLGRDYTSGGVIPAFDSAADKDHDGYLNDHEYAARRKGFDARFVYESRLTYPQYGPMRFATNVSDPGFRAWAVDYHNRYLATVPQADGFFVDNSVGRLAVDPAGVAERLDAYSADYGSLLGAVNKKLAAGGKWIIANTAGGNASAEPIIRNGVSYLEEFALRPMSANHVQFDDLTATVAYRRQLSGGKAYEVLDSLPTNGVDATDPRMQLATLAMYYLLADPNLSFLMVNGGNEPASGWGRHWIEAVTFDVGKPKEVASVFATGADPSNGSLTYKVYQREYQNALVLYKPVSYTRGVNGTTGNDTATKHRLDGWYRPVNADGSLGQPVRQVTLRNGEGVVLAKVR